MQLATRQRGLEHVAGIHRAFGLAGADHGVQLVDENNGLPFVLGQILEHVLQAFLELTTELGTGQQRGHVERQHALALERIGHLAGDDALGQALDDGGLADAGLADQHRVVLGAPLQHLDGAADFVIAPDHRVELALARALGQVQAVFLERFALVFRIRTVHILTTAHGVDRGFERLARQAVFAGDFADVELAVAQGQQEQFAGNELVAALDRFLFGRLQQADHVAPDLDLLLSLHLGQALERRLGRGEQARHVDAGTLQQGGRAVLLAQHGEQHMGRLDIGMVLAQRQCLGVAQGFLKFGGEFVDTHGNPSCWPTAWAPAEHFKPFTKRAG